MNTGTATGRALGGIAAARVVRQKTIAKYLENPNYCSLCKKPLLIKNNDRICDLRKRKYCSHACSASASNKQRKLKPFISCKKCREKFPDRNKREYCSKDCKPTLVDKWLDGTWNGTTKVGLSKTIRMWLLKEANYKCSQCSWSGTNPRSNKSTLQIEHKDGHYLNNKRENLIVLCLNCHSLTPTYGGLNKGNGRPFRYNREYSV